MTKSIFARLLHKRGNNGKLQIR